MPTTNMDQRMVALGRTPLSGAELRQRAGEYGQGLLDIPGTVSDYVARTDLRQFGQDIGQFARGMAQGAADDPVGFALDMIPVVGDLRAVQAAEELRGQARQLEESGDAEQAKQLRQLATVSMAGALPLIGTLRRAASGGTRPRVVASDDGTYITTRPEGMDPPGSRTERVFSQSEMENILTNPDTNTALRVADEYTQARFGRPYDPNLPMDTSLAKQHTIARTFDLAVEGTPEYKRAVFDMYANRYPDLVEMSGARNYDQLVERAYRQLGSETTDQFNRMPIQQTFHPGDLDYANSRAMVSDVVQNQNLNVFRGGDRHDFLHNINPRTGLNENEMFRGVHDYFGHAIRGNQFGPLGEEIAFASHGQMYSPLARAAAGSETRGQNSWVNYGGANLDLQMQIRDLRTQRDQAQRAGRTGEVAEIDAALREVGQQWTYAPQNAVLLPPEMLDINYRGQMPEQIRGLLSPPEGTVMDPIRATHFSRQPGLLELDPARYGTGVRGEERFRVLGPTRRQGAQEGELNRSYLYADPPETVRPETLMPRNAIYEANVSNLYDLQADPLRLRDQALFHNTTPGYSRMNPNAIDRWGYHSDTERLVRNHGYSGLLGSFGDNVSQPLMVFDPLPVRQVR